MYDKKFLFSINYILHNIMIYLCKWLLEIFPIFFYISNWIYQVLEKL